MYVEQTYGVSERRACRVLALHRSTKRRQPGMSEGHELVARIHALSERYPRFGYRKIYTLLKGEHWGVSRETVRRLRQREGLQVVKRIRKKRPAGVSTTTPTRAASPNHVWSETVAELPGLSSTCTMKRGKGLLTAFGLSFTPHIERQTRTDLR